MSLILLSSSGCRCDKKSGQTVASDSRVTSDSHSPSTNLDSNAAGMRSGEDDAGTQSPKRTDTARASVSNKTNRHKKEVQNEPPIGLYLSERLAWRDKPVTLRVHARAGRFFNCYYKGRKAAYHHVRLRGDGSAYLDGYIPRDKQGERLWIALQKNKSLKLTVDVVMRSETVSNICVGQVAVVDHRLGWDFDAGLVGPAGVLKRRIRNARDRVPTGNKPSLGEFTRMRETYVDKSVRLRVRARLDRKYHCRYRDAESTHYSVYLRGDAYKGLIGYVRRDDNGYKLARVLARDEDARLTVTITVPRKRYDALCADQVEVTAWESGWKRGGLR